MRAIHTPVLLDQVLHFLDPGEGKRIMVDANLGEGGHAEAFLKQFPDLMLLGVEVDRKIADLAKLRLSAFGTRFRLFNCWSGDFFKNYECYMQVAPDRILLDLGISSYHYEKGHRGFSFRRDEPLDMRLSYDLELTAGDLVNTYSQEALSDIIFQYGEERYSRRIAERIVAERKNAPIRSSLDLAAIIQRAVPQKYRQGRIHSATKTFQALRIAVNSELERLKEALGGAFHVLSAGGRMGVISFHSLEDRIVKRFFKEKNKSCTCPPEWPICKCGGRKALHILTGKPVRPTILEERENRASRSSKLRVAEKVPAVEECRS